MLCSCDHELLTYTCDEALVVLCSFVPAEVQEKSNVKGYELKQEL